MIKQENKIGILGVGAIGSVISFTLNQNCSNDLFYFSRTAKKRIKIEFENHKFEIPIRVQTKVENLPNLNWLIICLKEHQFSSAEKWFQNLINSNTKIAIIRNGLRLKELLLKFASQEHILECMIDCPTQYLENGFYQQLSKPQITISDNSLARDFAQLFDNKNIEIKLVSDFKTQNWEKLAESSALGGILCLTGETCWIFKDEKLRQLYVNILEEIVEVAQVDGAKIESDFIDKMLGKLMKYPKTKGSSMLSDRQQGKQIELGAKNGIISELSAFYKVKTPLNDLIFTLLTHTNRKN